MNPPIRRMALATAETISADWNSVTLINRNHRGVIVNFVFANEVDTVSVTPKIQELLPDGSSYRDILAGAAVTANGNVTLIVYPGAVAVSNLVANEPLPHKFRVLLTATWGGTDAIDVTVVAQFVP